METIHVRLLDEGVDVWRPVRARSVAQDVFEIQGPMPDDERWEFPPGTHVRCRSRRFQGSSAEVLTAIEKADASAVTFSFLRWRVSCEPERTRSALATAAPGPESCGCDPCRNFVALRSEAYPDKVVEFLREVGIDPVCEIEIVHYARVAPGKHLYGGWFQFVGSFEGEDAKRIVGAGGSFELVEVTPTFRLGLTRDAQLVPDALKGTPVVQVEFETSLPWRLSVAEPG